MVMTEQPIAVLMFVTSTYMCGLSLCLPVHAGCIVDWRLCVSQCIYPSIYCTVCIHLDYSTISIRLSYFYRNIYILYFYSPGSIYSSYHIYIYIYVYWNFLASRDPQSCKGTTFAQGDILDHNRSPRHRSVR